MSDLKIIHLASDHAGLELKSQVIQYLNSQIKDFKIIDHGPNENTSVDYPDFADRVCKELNSSTLNSGNILDQIGILICGSGQGMALRANKFQYIRAALVYNDEITKLSREHNNANIICLGSRFCTAEQAYKWINLFITTPFSEGRHALRVAKISQPTP